MSFILLKLFLDNSTRRVIRLYQAVYCEILLQAQALNHTLISANVIWINYRLQKMGHSSFHAQPCSCSLSFVTFNFSFPLFAQPQFSIFSLSGLSLGRNVNSTLFLSPCFPPSLPQISSSGDPSSQAAFTLGIHPSFASSSTGQCLRHSLTF